MHSYCDLSALEMVVPWAWAGATPMEKVDTICLVSCVSAKRTTPALAKDLYQSDWFIKARAYAESVGSCWFILSAKYGLVRPDEMIEPYEMTLNTMGVAERRNWSRRVQ